MHERYRKREREKTKERTKMCEYNQSSRWEKINFNIGKKNRTVKMTDETATCSSSADYIKEVMMLVIII